MIALTLAALLAIETLILALFVGLLMRSQRRIGNLQAALDSMVERSYVHSFPEQGKFLIIEPRERPARLFGEINAEELRRMYGRGPE